MLAQLIRTAIKGLTKSIPAGKTFADKDPDCLVAQGEERGTNNRQKSQIIPGEGEHIQETGDIPDLLPEI